MKHSVENILEIISKNEFSGLRLRAKVSEGSSQYGSKIRFTNMNTQYSELKSMLRPMIEKLSLIFKRYGLALRTKTKTSLGEVVEALEITFIIDKTSQKITELR